MTDTKPQPETNEIETTLKTFKWIFKLEEFEYPNMAKRNRFIVGVEENTISHEYIAEVIFDPNTYYEEYDKDNLLLVNSYDRITKIVPKFEVKVVNLRKIENPYNMEGWHNYEYVNEYGEKIVGIFVNDNNQEGLEFKVTDFVKNDDYGNIVGTYERLDIVDPIHESIDITEYINIRSLIEIIDTWNLYNSIT